MQGDFSKAVAVCREIITAAGEDFLSGASELAGRIAEDVLKVVDLLPPTQDRETSEKLLTLAEEVYRAKPFMAPFVRIANLLCLGAEAIAGPEAEEGIKGIRDEYIQLVGSLRSAGGRLVEVSAGVYKDLPRSPRILTYSRSSGVLAALKGIAGHPRLKPKEVIVPEGRPGYEGRTLAGELAGSGIDAVLITDAAAASYVSETDLLLLGADSVSPSFFVNKIGSLGLAISAREAGVPLYVMADTTKFLLDKLQLIDTTGHDPAQVYDVSMPRLKVDNRYFERVPLDLAAAIVTETGIMSQDQVNQFISGLRFSPRLDDWREL